MKKLVALCLLVLFASLIGCYHPTNGKLRYYSHVWDEGLSGGRDAVVVFENGTGRDITVDSYCNTGEFTISVPKHSVRSQTVYSGSSRMEVECNHFVKR